MYLILLVRDSFSREKTEETLLLLFLPAVEPIKGRPVWWLILHTPFLQAFEINEKSSKATFTARNKYCKSQFWTINIQSNTAQFNWYFAILRKNKGLGNVPIPKSGVWVELQFMYM